MTDTNQPASRKFGNYVPNKLMTSGEDSPVFKAIHKTTGEHVLLRLMTVTAKDYESALQNCQDVLDELIALNLPYTVPIKSYGIEGTTLYIVMDGFEGGTLRERLLRRFYADPNTPPELPAVGEVLSVAKRMAEALDALHAHDLVHGQIEPRSIVFDDSGSAYLAEIGLTRLMKIVYRLETTNSFNMTRYSPPELWEGQRPAPATDQYALACILYELLTGKAPFDGKSIYALMTAHANDVAIPPHYIRSELPASLGVIFWHALSKPVDRRYETVGMFVDDLISALSHVPLDRTDFFTFPLT